MKRKKVVIRILITTLVLSLPLVATAQESIFFIGQELGVGARAMGMGGAFVGVADDYSAMYWNPAGMGQIKISEFNISLSHNSFKNNVSFLGDTFESQNNFTRLNSIGVAFPVPTFQGSLVFGVGYNSVRDFEYSFMVDNFNPYFAAYQDWFLLPEDAQEGDVYTTAVTDSVQQKETIMEEGNKSLFSFSGAIEVQKNLFVGLTVDFLGGKDEYDSRLDEYDVLNLYNTPLLEGSTVIADLDRWYLQNQITSEFEGTRFTLGALYKLNRNTRVGLQVVAPTRITIKETWQETQEEWYDGVDESSYYSNDGEYEYRIREPYSFSFGGSVNIFRLLLSGAVEFKDWTQAEFLDDPSVSGVTKSDINMFIQQNLRAVTKLRFGAELYIPELQAKIRGGYFKNPSAYENSVDQNVFPDKTYYSGGISFRVGRTSIIDLAVVQASWKRQVFDSYLQYDPEQTVTQTKEDISFLKVIGSLSFQF